MSLYQASAFGSSVSLELGGLRSRQARAQRADSQHYSHRILGSTQRGHGDQPTQLTCSEDREASSAESHSPANQQAATQNVNYVLVFQFSCSVVSYSLRLHGLQHARLPCLHHLIFTGICFANSGFIHHSQKADTTQCQWMDDGSINVVHPHSGILLSLKKEVLTPATTWTDLKDMMLSERSRRRRKNTVLLYSQVSGGVRSIETGSRWWGQRLGEWSQCLMRLEV